MRGSISFSWPTGALHRSTKCNEESSPVSKFTIRQSVSPSRRFGFFQPRRSVDSGDSLQEASEEYEDIEDVPGFEKTDPRLQALWAAFKMIDHDRNGRIDSGELVDLLNWRGVDMSDAEASAVIKMYSSDDESETMSFADFCHVMRDFEGAEVIDITRAFVKEAEMRSSGLFSSSAGIVSARMSMMTRRPHEFEEPHNARLACGKVVDGPWVHSCIFILIMIDVIVVIMEMLLVMTWCNNPNARRLHDFQDAELNLHLQAIIDAWRFERRLAGTPMPPIPAQDTAWCTSCAQTQHDVESVLHYISVSILIIFAFQILLVMLAYGLAFFRNFFFVLDAIVVSGALVLEIAFHVREGALLALLLTWRFGRIVHGLVTTVEIGHKKIHARINNVIMHQLEVKARNMREIKEDLNSLNVASKDLSKARALLKPSGLTVDNVDSLSIDVLKRNCKLQIMNNRDVLDALDKLAEDLTTMEERIDDHLHTTSAQREDLAHHTSHPLARMCSTNNLPQALTHSQSLRSVSSPTPMDRLEPPNCITSGDEIVASDK